MSGGSGVELARRSCSPLDPLVGRSEVEASQRILDPRGVGAPPQRSANQLLDGRISTAQILIHGQDETIT
jgi:hypothetical protein